MKVSNTTQPKTQRVSFGVSKFVDWKDVQRVHCAGCGHYLLSQKTLADWLRSSTVFSGGALLDGITSVFQNQSQKLRESKVLHELQRIIRKNLRSGGLTLDEAYDKLLGELRTTFKPKNSEYIDSLDAMAYKLRQMKPDLPAAITRKEDGRPSLLDNIIDYYEKQKKFINGKLSSDATDELMQKSQFSFERALLHSLRKDSPHITVQSKKFKKLEKTLLPESFSIFDVETFAVRKGRHGRYLANSLIRPFTLTSDHVIPVEAMGPDFIENYIPMHQYCNCWVKGKQRLNTLLHNGDTTLSNIDTFLNDMDRELFITGAVRPSQNGKELNSREKRNYMKNLRSLFYLETLEYRVCEK